MTYELTEEQKRYSRYPDFEPKATSDLSYELQDKYLKFLDKFGGKNMVPVQEGASREAHVDFVGRVIEMERALDDMRDTIVRKGVWIVPAFRLWLEREYLGKWIRCPVISFQSRKTITGLFKVAEIEYKGMSCCGCTLYPDIDQPYYKFKLDRKGRLLDSARISREDLEKKYGSSYVNMDCIMNRMDDYTHGLENISVVADPWKFLENMGIDRDAPVRRIHEI